MRIVITYQDRGDNKYLPLIEMAFKSAKRLGYETVIVSNQEDLIQNADLQLYLPADQEKYLMPWILAAQLHYINSPLFSCNSIFFSPDALIIKPLGEIFMGNFDVGFTDRPHSKWPINNGVIFMKHLKKAAIAALWEDALKICREYPQKTQEWYGDQQALGDLMELNLPLQHEVNVTLFPCARFNVSPANEHLGIDQMLLDASYVIHFKGIRKNQMKIYWERLCQKS